MSRRLTAKPRSASPSERGSGNSHRALCETVALQAARIDQLLRQLTATQQQLEALTSQVAMITAPPAPAAVESKPEDLPKDLVQWLPVFLREQDVRDPSDWTPDLAER